MSSYWNARECQDHEHLSGGTPDEVPEPLLPPALAQLRDEALARLQEQEGAASAAEQRRRDAAERARSKHWLDLCAAALADLGDHLAPFADWHCPTEWKSDQAVWWFTVRLAGCTPIAAVYRFDLGCWRRGPWDASEPETRWRVAVYELATRIDDDGCDVSRIDEKAVALFAADLGTALALATRAEHERQELVAQARQEPAA